MKDFTPTKETITLHGLGFIQLKLQGNQRLHVWHPELPRRKCFATTKVHNHRFGFISTVLVGTQINRRVDVIRNDEKGAWQLISHDGPRSKFGGRESFYIENQYYNLKTYPEEKITAGSTYSMAPGEFHSTECDGIVVTLMQKTDETDIHANSVGPIGSEFDQKFDRFQLSPDELFDYVRQAIL